ncbi:UNVERIFIED_CONTAM: hypothetical protein K2H54_038111 [Gekko kuhli]
MTMEELTQELLKARAEMDRVRDKRKELGDDPDSLASRPVGDPKHPTHAMKVRLQNRQLFYRDKITVISCAMDHLKDTEQERPGDQEMEVGEGGEEASTGEGTQEGPGRDPPNESEVHSGIPLNQEQYRQEQREEDNQGHPPEKPPDPPEGGGNPEDPSPSGTTPPAPQEGVEMTSDSETKEMELEEPAPDASPACHGQKEQKPDRSAVQRAWTWGPSLWTLAEEGAGGVAILTRFRRGLRIVRTIEATPGHLLVTDFDLEMVGGTPGRRFRLCALYAPIHRKRRRALWNTLHDYMCTSRELLVVGDFNVRSERHLVDTALEMVNVLDYIPTHHRTFFHSKYNVPQDCAMTYFHPLAVSRLDRVWCGKGLHLQSCRLLVNPWSDHAMVRVMLTSEVFQSCTSRRRWTLRETDLRAFHLERKIILTVEFHKRFKASSDPITWWEGLKRAIKRTCQQARRNNASRELMEHHRAIQNVLATRWKMAKDISCNQERLRESQRRVKEYQARQRQRRHTKKVARASGPVIQRGEWHKDRVPETSQTLAGLRTGPEEQVQEDPESTLEVISRYYGDLYGKDSDPRAREGTEAYLERAGVRRAASGPRG